MEKTELKELLSFAVDLARGAGEITLKYFKQSPETKTKADGSFVTVADREAESFLRREILARFPTDSILGEEDGGLEGKSSRRWIIDPIDGTFSFVHGVPFYGVLLALENEGEMMLGVVNLPALDEIVYAARSIGCFFNGKLTQVSSTERLSDALVLCTDFASCERHGKGPAAVELQRACKTSRTWGDCYGYVLVASGRADVMLDPVMNLWDCAAIVPIIEEAGGTFTDWIGRQTAGGGNAIATNGKLFDQVMRVVTSNES